MYGPYIKFGKTKRQTYLLAFIDDASRLITYAQFFFSQGFDSLRFAFKEAVLRRGVPTLLYTDNGKIYRSQQFEYICADIGCTLIHTKPFTPTSKGKIERFFLTVRQRFLATIDENSITSLDELNEKFLIWLNSDYQKKIHSSLNGLTPLDFFISQVNRAKIFTNPDILTEKFLYRVKRKIKHDCTFSIDKILYETSQKFSGSEVEIRYDPTWLGSTDKELLIFLDNLKVGTARMVSFHDNAHMARNKNIKEPSSQTLSFTKMEDC